MDYPPSNDPADASDEGAGGIYTTIPFLPWSKSLTKRCGAFSFLPILTLTLFLADIVLTIFAGLDAVDQGLNRPWLQFSYSLSVAFLYTALFVVALVMYRWERILYYRYHWPLTLLVAAVLMWINFAIWASWLGRYASFGNGVTASDGNAFVTWVAVNAIGVVGFLLRFVVFALGQGLRYTYDRTKELQSAVLSRTSGGKSLVSVVQGHAGGSYARTRMHAYTNPFTLSASGMSRGRRRVSTKPDRFERQFAGTHWAQRNAQDNGY